MKTIPCMLFFAAFATVYAACDSQPHSDAPTRAATTVAATDAPTSIPATAAATRKPTSMPPTVTSTPTEYSLSGICTIDRTPLPQTAQWPLSGVSLSISVSPRGFVTMKAADGFQFQWDDCKILVGASPNLGMFASAAPTLSSNARIECTAVSDEDKSNLPNPARDYNEFRYTEAGGEGHLDVAVTQYLQPGLGSGSPMPPPHRESFTNCTRTGG